ncbi:protein transport protein Sec24A [Condylostylus longicornis]|uniref:protein transport protein Sec24A n=1 Tax=Condylostylus longicornis TaxID=2530218 RepID=UPI00244DBA56|nr:protein transport protein Sec24A [Condylostylus longicornis]XP_055374326.1 protein transport protein Sec24A [Condylostylus longicornis]XP_055374327.1 protein transport protein Sec24A [Condylostylus longicornis]XP_055374328.1 protein transport protein Sec24A [Condylostylus longicornis]XP_055374329.1 protein transport protein Sec24A [Condylostylus longicornis]
MSSSYPNPNQCTTNMAAMPSNYVNGPFQKLPTKQSHQITTPTNQSNNQQMKFNLKPISSSSNGNTQLYSNTQNQQNSLTSSTSQANQTNLPSHIRTNVHLLNGGGSNNSSRTASPAINNTTNLQQAMLTTSVIQNTNQIVNMQMQNLSLNSNQNTMMPTKTATIQQSSINQLNQYSVPVNNHSLYPYNFKTNALNSDLQPNRSSNNETSVQAKADQVNYSNSEKNNLNRPISSSLSHNPVSFSASQQTNAIIQPSKPLGGGTFDSNVINNNMQQISTQAMQPPSITSKPTQNKFIPMPLSNTQFQSPQVAVSSAKPNGTQYPQQFPTVNNSNCQPHFVPPNCNQNYIQPPPPTISMSQNLIPQQQQTFNDNQNVGPIKYQQNLGSVTQQGFNRLWGQDIIDLMQHRHILSSTTIQIPKITLSNQFQESVNCNPDIMRCTLNKIPENNSLLQKSRLPLGILVHPFRDINSLPVIQCPNIVRCRLCRTYINPFVHFVDSKMWKCNLCYRVNELPDDFHYDPASKTYGDVTRRPEVRSSTIEFIAPSEYMLRPPQPAIYLFLFDVSILAQQSGYLDVACSALLKYLDDMPGDARAQVGFIAYNSHIHFYNIAEGSNQPREMTLVDIEDPFIPCPDNLLVNLKECKELVKDLLSKLPTRFADSHDPGSCLGAALQVAFKLMMSSGGRVTVFQTCLPNKGVGLLEPREDPNNRSSKDVAHLNPATDFYKRHALECSGYQIAVDLFVLNQQYVDLATISGISKHSGGSIHHFPLFQKTKPHHVDSFKQCLKRYLTGKIGFEAVMRIRCTRGLQVHTFHGNFFVRSTDLLSLPNVNPDAGYGMQISYEENLSDVKTICFQAALLYTNSDGERRIRVHTLCLPVTNNLNEVMHSADSQAIVGLLSKMAVDRSLTSSLADAREAFINATIDILSAFKLGQNYAGGQSGQLMAPKNLALLPLYILALLKHMAFRVGTSTRLDDRISAMNAMKNLPLDQLMKYIYPEFYQIDALFYNLPEHADEEESLPDIPLLQLTAEFLDSRSMFLIDSGQLIIIYVGLNVPQNILENVLGVKSTAEIPDICYNLPSIDTAENFALKSFIDHLNEEKPYLPTIQIIRDTSTCKSTFMGKLVDDRSDSSLSYYEFLQHLRTQVK